MEITSYFPETMQETIREMYGVTIRDATDLDYRVVSDLPIQGGKLYSPKEGRYTPIVKYLETAYDFEGVIRDFTATVFREFKGIESESKEPVAYWSIDPRRTSLELFAGKFTKSKTLPGALLRMEEYAQEQGDVHSAPSSDFEEYFGEEITSMANYRSLLDLSSTMERVTEDKDSLFPTQEELEEALEEERRDSYFSRDRELAERVIRMYEEDLDGYNYLIPFPSINII